VTVRGAVDEDGGSATVWVAMATTVLCAVFAIVLAMGQAVVARHRAGAAADLAALAAADHALSGTADACGRASRVARAQGAEVVRCAVTGEVADVTALARFGPYAPVVRARAGPQGLPDPARPDSIFRGPTLRDPTRRGPTLPEAGLQETKRFPGPAFRKRALPDSGFQERPGRPGRVLQVLPGLPCPVSRSPGPPSPVLRSLGPLAGAP
jgi:secretion/DNA translocation related TadE-like protein